MNLPGFALRNQPLVLILVAALVAYSFSVLDDFPSQEDPPITVRECVVVTYPTADEAGRPLRVSPFADDLRAAYPQLAVHAIEAPIRSRQMWSLMSSDDLAAGLALEFRSRPALPDDETPGPHR